MDVFFMNNYETEKCQDNVQKAEQCAKIENPTLTDLINTAELFFEAASCFDQSGDRKNAATYFSLAAEFYMTAGEQERGSECYGKSILRALMANDLETARVILEKGNKYNLNNLFHFRLAREAFSQRITDELDQFSYTESSSSITPETIDSYDEIVSSDLLMDHQELEEILIEAGSKTTDILPTKADSKTFFSSTKEFTITSDVSHEKANKIIESLLLTVKRSPDTKTISISTAKTESGKTLDIKHTTFIKNKDELLNSEHQLPDSSNKTDKQLQNLVEFSNDQIDLIDISSTVLETIELSSTITATSLTSVDSSNVFSSPSSLQKLPLNVDSDTINNKQNDLSNPSLLDENVFLAEKREFLSVTEFSNTFNEELNDVEIRDTIPLGWKPIKVETSNDVQFLRKDFDEESGSLIFTWKRNKLRSGERARIQYTLTKRIQRTIIGMSGQKLAMTTSYHDIEKSGIFGLISEIPFTNIGPQNLDYLMIEDIIPPELKVTGIIPSDFNYIRYLTKDGILFHWSLKDLNPKQSFDVQYQFIERPITLWYTEEMSFIGFPNAKLNFSKIVEPLIDKLEHEYLFFYEINFENLPEISLDLLEILPSKQVLIELIANQPSWMLPTFEFSSSTGGRWLAWRNLELSKTKTIKFITRIRADRPIEIKSSELLFSQKGEKFTLIESTTLEENLSEKLDLRVKLGYSVIKNS